jgi:hypothetical protein
LIQSDRPSPQRVWSRPEISTARSTLMLDVVMLALGLSFFVVAIGYAYACERL